MKIESEAVAIRRARDAGLAGGRPMAHGKKTREGAEERLRVLTSYEPDARALLPRAAAPGVASDDVIDALAALMTAETPMASLTSLPAEPERDENGLPMAIAVPAVPCAVVGAASIRTGSVP